MGNTTALKGLLAGCLLLAAGVGPVSADPPPSVAQLLSYMKPKFQDVALSTPTPEEYASCEVKVINGPRPKSSGYVLLDAKKQPMRRLFATDGSKIDMWSYFKDGVEVYREMDTNGNRAPDQFRWLNGAGMKWGISSKEDGKINQWKMISAEEAAQEVFTALATGDFARLQALFISEAELRTLPAPEAQRMIALLKGASIKFQATRAKLPQIDARARFVRVESATPHCMPIEVAGAEQDQLRFPYRTILFETGEKDKTKHDFVQTGEMIKIGLAWRLVDGPSLPDSGPGDDNNSNNPALNKLYDELTLLDKNPPPPPVQPKIDKAVQDYNLRRVALISKILEHVQGTEKESWIKQSLDNLSSAYQAGNQASLIILTEQRDQIVKNAPGSELAAFATYRHLWALYAEKLNKDSVKIQNEWLDQLAKFAQAYPKSEDTPEALRLLAIGCEYSGKDEESKRWNQLIFQNFPNHPLAPAAQGAVKRLDLIGREIALTGPQLANNAPYNIANQKGKLVVVYYWSSNVKVCEADFNTLKRLQAANAKDLELVCISLDDNPREAAQFLQKAQVPATNLYMPGGFNSPLATFYGINTLPTMFLVGKDGRVINRTLQANDLEIELRKAL